MVRASALAAWPYLSNLQQRRPIALVKDGKPVGVPEVRSPVHSHGRDANAPQAALPCSHGAGLMPRKKPEHPPVHRTDLLRSNLTAQKAQAVMELLRAWRRGAVLLGREQWRLFFESGHFDQNHDIDKVSFATVIGAANRVQMCRYQVVGQLQGWISNRQNAFRDVVQGSRLAPGTCSTASTVAVGGSGAVSCAWPMAA